MSKAKELTNKIDEMISVADARKIENDIYSILKKSTVGVDELEKVKKIGKEVGRRIGVGLLEYADNLPSTRWLDNDDFAAAFITGIKEELSSTI